MLPTISPTLTPIDTPKNVILTPLERSIIELLADGKMPKDISIQLGIPRVAITTLLRKEGVSEFVQELVDARNQAMKMYLPDLLMSIIEDKIAKNMEDEDARLSDLTRKDVIDIARTLTELTKSTSSQKDEPQDRFTQLYQQINLIQGGGK